MIDLYGINKPIWPIHPAPLEGEILSSWMVRLAHLNGFRVYPFYSQHLGAEKSIWTRDIDRSTPEWLIIKLSEWTRVPQGIIRSTTLKSYEGYLSEQLNLNGNSKCILPLGIFHRTRKRHSLQYRPVCLSEDETPYFRKVWRVSFFAVCPKHSVMLNDRCHNCGSPVVFTRSDMHQKNWSAETSRFDVCSFCREPLHAPIINKAYPAYDESNAIIWKWFRAVETGFISIGQHEGLYSFLAFQVLHQLCKLLISSNRKCGLPYRLLAKKLDMPYVEPINGVFEYNPVDVRCSVVWIAMWMLEDWPERFIQIITDAELSSSWILKDMDASVCPYWFASVVKDNFYRVSNSF